MSSRANPFADLSDSGDGDALEVMQIESSDEEEQVPQPSPVLPPATAAPVLGTPGPLLKLLMARKSSRIAQKPAQEPPVVVILSDTSDDEAAGGDSDMDPDFVPGGDVEDK